MKDILVVDDEPKMRNLVRIYLENAMYTVKEAVNGEHALASIEQARPHLVILDIMMPGINGFDTCGRIRDEYPDIPILMLTARTSIDDKVFGLSRGADDYLTKPFDGRELVARVHALIRRAYPVDGDILRFDEIGLVIDVVGRIGLVCNRHILFTPKEFDLILLLARHPGRIFPREEILERIWAYEFEGEIRAVDSHVKNIREKLRDAGIEHCPIKTVWGVGYKFEVEA